MRKLLPAALAAAALISSSCIPPPDDNDLIIDYKLDTAMGVIQDRGELRVGLEQYSQPFGSQVVPDGRGFVFDYANDIAEALDVDAHFAVATPQRLLDGVKEGVFDVVFPLAPITEDAARHFAVTDPYYVGHQRLLVRRGSPIRGLDDIGSTDLVCVYPDDSDTADLASVLSAEQLLEPSTRRGAFVALHEGRCDAIAARDVLVMRLARTHRAFEFVGEQISTEGYGALVLKDPPGLAEFVNGVLGEAKAEGRWQQWYREWIAPRLGGGVPEPPTMTAEEAAALFPAEAES
jgi:ABC-type amino acid transport substrate-binding protein